MFTRPTRPLTLLAALAFDTPALAASFNCANSSHPDEATICSNQSLSNVDLEDLFVLAATMDCSSRLSY